MLNIELFHSEKRIRWVHYVQRMTTMYPDRCYCCLSISTSAQRFAFIHIQVNLQVHWLCHLAGATNNDTFFHLWLSNTVLKWFISSTEPSSLSVTGGWAVSNDNLFSINNTIIRCLKTLTVCCVCPAQLKLTTLCLDYIYIYIDYVDRPHNRPSIL